MRHYYLEDSDVEEIWVPVKGFEGKYEVSTWGEVRSLDRSSTYTNSVTGKVITRKIKGRVLTPKIVNAAYFIVDLSKGKRGDIKQASVHRLVAEHFLPNPENKPQVNHIDGNPNNNSLSNLEWVTVSENAIHSYETLGKGGESHGLAKLTEESVKEMRKLYGTYNYTELGEMFGVHKSTVARACQGLCWGFVKDNEEET